MEFKRINPAGRTFSGGGFKLTRPSGPRLSRDGLDLRAKGHDYDVRREGREIWLMEGDRIIGYASGQVDDWHVLIDDHPYSIEQPELGRTNSALMSGEERVAEIEGSGFPLRGVRITTILNLSDEQKAFVVLVVLLGWRESDRSLFGSIESGAEGPAGP